MNNYVFITDSTTDLPPELAKEMEIKIIPLYFVVDNKDYVNYLDNSELSPKEFYNAMREGKKTSTSQITTYRFVDEFEPFVAEGKDVLYLALSSGLSGTYEQALAAADVLMEKYPGRKIVIADSVGASMGEGLIAYLTAEQVNNGLSLEEAVSFVNEIKYKVCHWFTVADLVYLKRSGRVSAAAAAFGNILNIKPVLHVDNEGKLIPVMKARGRNKAIEALVDAIGRMAVKPEEQVIFLSHGDAFEDITAVAEMIKTRFNPKRIVISNIGPVIGSHSGPGTLALFFLGEKRH